MDDRISTLPQPILETILCFLPTKEAARTSILSTEWRHKWTKIPKLDLCHSKKKPDVESASELFYDIHQVLLLHKGPIHELALDIEGDYDYLEFDQIILNLSRNHTVKKLSIFGSGSRWDKLPISIFSLHHLTNLSIRGLALDHPPIFNGFDSLVSLELTIVDISKRTLLHLLSNCPSLKRLSLLIGHSDYYDICTINELFKCLPVIEHLTTRHEVSKWLDIDLVPQELRASLIRLKYVYFEEICFFDGYGLAFLLVLFRCAPNLEKIKLDIDSWHPFKGDDCSFAYGGYSVAWEEYSDVWLEQLNELEIKCFCNLKLEMEFVKFILARSPKLKKVSIHIFDKLNVVGMDRKMEMLEDLLQTPRASPVRIYISK